MSVLWEKALDSRRLMKDLSEGHEDNIAISLDLSLLHLLESSIHHHPLRLPQVLLISPS